MGSSDVNKASKEKEPKTPAATTTQEPSSAPSTGTVNADWSGFQAYSPMPPHGFMAQSPQGAPPFMWGMQHMMPPYGTPPHPYMAMYPHGVYAHPSMPPGSYPFSPFAMPSPNANGIAEASGNTPGNVEADGKSSEVKDKLPVKRSKRSLGSLINMITGKNNEPGKTSGASANGGYSKSGESGSEGTSDGSDANSQNDSQLKSGGEASQNGSSAHGRQNGGPNTSHAILNQSMSIVPMSTAGAAAAVPGPTTNLHIGMEYWGAPASSAMTVVRGKAPSTPVDERELKRQRRKQSNRESARRSRLRKQAECDELAQRAEVLKEENANLRSEVSRIQSEYDQLLAENASLKVRLAELPGNEGKNDQHTSNEGQAGQAEAVQTNE